MDKYEFNIKVEQLRKLVNKGDFETAMKIADTIDWKKVRNANLLSMVAQIYEKNEEYQEAKDILLLAFERAPIGKRLLYKLTELALKEKNTEEAEAYYREFCDLAGDDPRQQLLRYMILKEKGAPNEQLVHSLEGYTSEELDEKWLFELAELYHEAGNEAMCIATCDKIMLMFGLGKYVDKAMELKIQYAPLTKYQMDLVENRDKYEEKLRAVEQGISHEVGNEEDDYDATEASPVETPVIAGAPDPVEEITEDPVPEPVHVEPSKSQYSEDVIAAEVKQAEVEARLAREMSKIKVEFMAEDEDEAGKTRVIGDLKRAQVLSQETMVLPNISKLIDNAKVLPEEPVKPLVDEDEEMEPEIELPKLANHLMIEARTPEKGLEVALQTLKLIQEETGVKNPIAKIAGSKLNKRGIMASIDRLTGKDLLVEEAGDLSPEVLKELEILMTQDASGMRIILIDNPKQMKMLHRQNPSLSGKFECIGSGEVFSETVEEIPEADSRPVRHIQPEREFVSGPRKAAQVQEPAPEEQTEGVPEQDGSEMDIDEFAQYACRYASEIDCSITGKSMLALYERIEIMEEEGILLTRRNAEDLIEEAADKAERPSIGKLITGVFSAKYDKDGLLILREEHFI